MPDHNRIHLIQLLGISIELETGKPQFDERYIVDQLEDMHHTHMFALAELLSGDQDKAKDAVMNAEECAHKAEKAWDRVVGMLHALGRPEVLEVN